MVLCTSHTYRAVRYAIDDSISRHNADVLCLDIPKQIKNEEQVFLYDNYNNLITLEIKTNKIQFVNEYNLY